MNDIEQMIIKLVLVGFGALIIAKRKPYARSIVEQQRNIFKTNIGKQQYKLMEAQIITVGVIAILLGVFSLVFR